MQFNRSAHMEVLESRRLLSAGLTAKYYDNDNLTGKSISQIDSTVNFNWGSGKPLSGIGSDSFSARWTGTVRAEETEKHKFYVTADDGVRLWVNDEQLIDAWSNRSKQTHSASIELDAGRRYSIKLEYRERSGSASVKLEWSSESIEREIIPVTALGTAKLHPGEIWLDTDGEVINAHGGGMLYRNGSYYWYGELRGPKIYTHPDTGVPFAGFAGISVYSSTDLMNWKNRGLALPAVNDPKSDLFGCRIVERPKVIYNKSTGKYVMWMHIEDPSRTVNRVGVATSNSATGPFKYRGSFRPLGLVSRDMTLFQEENGKAYLIFATGRSTSLRIARLSDDYLGLSGEISQPYETEDKREAPALLKVNGKYFLLTSRATRWDPNPGMYAVADNVMGPYKIKGNPFYGSDASTSYDSQPTYILPIAGKSNAFIYLGDRWQEGNLPDSRYIWLPLRINGTTMTIDPIAPWDLTTFD